MLTRRGQSRATRIHVTGAQRAFTSRVTKKATSAKRLTVGGRGNDRMDGGAGYEWNELVRCRRSRCGRSVHHGRRGTTLAHKVHAPARRLGMQSFDQAAAFAR